ncbi:MAG: response regulator [Nitrospirae bacterium]|nr:response regulator [Nitrospirota bacterium]
MPIESRRKKRVTITGEVTIDDKTKAKGLDFSTGGMYVFTKEPFEKGRNIRVTIPFKAKTLDLSAIVQHVEECAGMGLRFINMDEAQKALIKEFLDYFDARTIESSKKTVLIADGNEVTRKCDRNRLAFDGFAVIDCSNGVEVLEVLEDEKVDIVIADLFLEKMDAFKLLSLMKQTPSLKDIPVLVLSASNKPEDINRASAAGAVAILPKATTSPMKLGEKVKEILKV